jgi:hypothetical protein
MTIAGAFSSGYRYNAGRRDDNQGMAPMLRSLKPLILWLDARFTWLWNDAARRKEVFIHGEFTYGRFIKDNVHLFLVLGLFGAITGYLNTFIEREVPFNAYAGKLGVNHTPFSMLQSVMGGQNPLAAPFPPADLLFGIACSLLMLVILAMAILWAAVNYRVSDKPPSSELHLLSRVSFVTLFGSLMLVFMSYLIRNYGLLIQALLEIFSAFAALYVLAFVVKRSKNPWLWLAIFILLGLVDYLLWAYLPVVSIFVFALGLASFLLTVIMAPFLLVKKTVRHLKERHLS